ncbi:sugar efflux transporter [Saccharospirillum mangrovi]|uniref:sugar efflux transporter n=1 Tax=Saccharospirillum mangrovi TaxID=2161747 RepID=UPI00130033B7|nr:sugar efflux transporter [Saccharospirillum mangrovi]
MTLTFWLQPTILRLLALCLLLGTAGASVFPVLSTHLASNLGIEPLWIGVFFGANTLAGIGVSLWLARRSDAGMSRMRILVISVSISMLGSIGLGYLDWYPALLLAGMIWFGLSSTAQPQLFALAREQVDDRQAALFQSVLRATISMSWIAGPPLAYVLFEVIGFRHLMLVTAGLFGLCLLLLPGLKDARMAPATTGVTVTDPRILGLTLVIVCLFAANSMYVVYMPIYVRDVLGLLSIAPGLLMGLAAGLEIPIMIGAGAQAYRWPLFSPLKVAALCGVFFYLGVWWFDSFSAMLALQIFNAGLVGLAAGLGISIFQTLMKDRLGMASTLYTNAIKIGSLIGSALGGVIAQVGGFDWVFLFCALLSLVALVLVYALGYNSASTSAKASS